MEKLLYLVLNKEDGKKLKEVFRDMKPMDAFYGFVYSCIRKYNYKKAELEIWSMLEQF